MSPRTPVTPAASLDQLVGTTVDGKYRIQGLLGHGGMGAVFRALHLGTDRTVAVKVIVPHHASRTDFQARFEREARACGRLRHPNIVDVTDFGYDQAGGQRIAYLVMEYLDGCSLADVLHGRKALPIAWVVDVLQQAGSALEEAHRASILHRDLKPDNMWLEPNRRGGYTVKILDFGLAKLSLHGGETDPTADVSAGDPEGTPEKEKGDLTEAATILRGAANASTGARAADTEAATLLRPNDAVTFEPEDADLSATVAGSIMGTPAYMSPEQCRGLPLTPRSDVYSLGVIAYRMLGGELPFSGSGDALLAAHIRTAPRPLLDLRPSTPKDVAALIMRALAKDPEERPRSAGAFAEMLAAHAQTTMGFLEEAILMFATHARAFLSASVVGLSPVLLMGFLAAMNALAFVYGVDIVSPVYGRAVVVAAILMTVGPGMFLLQGAVVPAVMQAVVSPLRPIDVQSLARRFRPRLRAYLRAVGPLIGLFLVAGLWQLPMTPVLAALRPFVQSDQWFHVLGGSILLIVLPNFPVIVLVILVLRAGSIRSVQMIAAVAVVEGLSARESRERAILLARSGDPMRPIRALLIGLGGLIGFGGAAGFVVLTSYLPAPVAVGMLGILFALAFVVLGPFSAVINALTYLRARRAMGEPLDEALADFERAVLPADQKLGDRERIATLIASGR